jgi:hypothetical protein
MAALMFFIVLSAVLTLFKVYLLRGGSDKDGGRKIHHRDHRTATEAQKGCRTILLCASVGPP